MCISKRAAEELAACRKEKGALQQKLAQLEGALIDALAERGASECGSSASCMCREKR